jgi:hypothetical protein
VRNLVRSWASDLNGTRIRLNIVSGPPDAPPECVRLDLRVSGHHEWKLMGISHVKSFLVISPAEAHINEALNGEMNFCARVDH